MLILAFLATRQDFGFHCTCHWWFFYKDTDKRYKEEVIPNTIQFFCCHFVNKHKTYIYTYRSRPSPNKKVAKKLFTAEQAGDDSGSGNDGADAPD
jgi:hypothetical protein